MSLAPIVLQLRIGSRQLVVELQRVLDQLDEAPPQLAGGAGQLVEPSAEVEPAAWLGVRP